MNERLQKMRELGQAPWVDELSREDLTHQPTVEYTPFQTDEHEVPEAPLGSPRDDEPRTTSYPSIFSPNAARLAAMSLLITTTSSSKRSRAARSREDTIWGTTFIM